MQHIHESIATNEPIMERRVAALQSVEIQNNVMKQFAEQYRFTTGSGSEDGVQPATDYLNKTFFRGLIENGRRITSYHQMQVITVSLETGLNPFNNELYGVFTPFGDLKVMATIDGWMRLATSQDIVDREFTYSDTSEIVEINGHSYSVPTWIECKLHSKEKGKSQAREYFWEVYNNSLNQTLTWSRPARTLANVVFIQTLRRMLRVTALADSDIIADINRHYEAEMAMKSCNQTNHSDSPKSPEKRDSSNELNININDIEIIDLENDDNVSALDSELDEKVISPETEPLVENKQSQLESETNSNSEEPQPESSDIPVVKETDHSDETPHLTGHIDLEEISETSVPREVLMVIKPLIQKVKYGQSLIESLTPIRNIITSEIGLKWFDQEVKKLK